MRLAFSVAAHLEPEILIIDEVLSVGDIAFQEKCLGRMEEASARDGPSSSSATTSRSVRNLCDRALMLSPGPGRAPPARSREVVDAYVGDVATDARARSLRERENRGGNGELRFTDLRLETRRRR